MDYWRILKMTVLQVFELIYYISFIVLTAVLAYYAFKSYKLGANRRYELLSKLTIPDMRIEKSEFYYYLEIYNAGNIVAKNIEVYIQEKRITRIDFVKPNSTELYPLGVIGCMLNGNRSMPGGYASVNKGETLNIHLLVDSKSLEFSLNTDILFETRPSESYLQNIDHSLETIARKVDKIGR